MHNTLDIVNQRFGLLKVIRRSGSTAKAQSSLWLCQCDCGNTTVVRGHSLKKNTRSCGCLKGRSIIHGYAKRSGRHPLYFVWNMMLQRCTNPNNTDYKYYGARGIKVCKRWMKSMNFIADVLAEIGERPPGLTLDRINTNKDYKPGNIRWATRAEQSRNRRPWGCRILAMRKGKDH